MSLTVITSLLDLRAVKNIFFNTNEVVNINIRRARDSAVEKFFVAYSYIFSINDIPMQLRTFYRQEDDGQYVPYIMISIGSILDDDTIDFSDVIILRDPMQNWWQVHEYLEAKRRAQGGKPIRLTPVVDTEPEVTISTPDATLEIPTENPTSITVEQTTVTTPKAPSGPINLGVRDEELKLPKLIEPKKARNFANRERYLPRAEFERMFRNDASSTGPIGRVSSSTKRTTRDFKDAFDLFQNFYLRDLVEYDKIISNLLSRNADENIFIEGVKRNLTSAELSYLEREQQRNVALFNELSEKFTRDFNNGKPYKYMTVLPRGSYQFPFRKIYPRTIRGGILISAARKITENAVKLGNYILEEFINYSPKDTSPVSPENINASEIVKRPIQFGEFRFDTTIAWLNLSLATEIKDDYRYDVKRNEREQLLQSFHSYSFNIGTSPCQLVERNARATQTELQFFIKKRLFFKFETFTKDTNDIFRFLDQEATVTVVEATMEPSEQDLLKRRKRFQLS